MESNKEKTLHRKKNGRTSLYSSQKRTRVQNEEEVNTSDEDSEDDVIFMKEVSGPPLSEFNLAQVKTDGEPDTTEAKKETTPRRRLYHEDRETTANTAKMRDKANLTTSPDESSLSKKYLAHQGLTFHILKSS